MEKSDAVDGLAALAHKSRLDVFRLLVQAGREGVAAGEIAERLRLPAATLSFHLSHLKRAGLVTARRDSRSLIYAAEYTAMTALLDYLTENCCQGDATACGAGACDPSTIAAERKRHDAAAGTRSADDLARSIR